jgi:hypothetical protein
MEAHGGKEPSQRSTDKTEARLARFLARRRQATRATLDDKLSQKLSNQLAKALCMWIYLHGGKAPSQKSENETEAILAHFLEMKKQADKEVTLVE